MTTSRQNQMAPILQIYLELMEKDKRGENVSEEMRCLASRLKALEDQKDLTRLVAVGKKLECANLTHFDLSLIGKLIREAYDRSLVDSDLLAVEGDRASRPISKSGYVVALENLQSAINVGSIVRTAECLGFAEVWLIGHTPGPGDKGYAKSVMGADLPVKRFVQLSDLLERVEVEGRRLIAVEKTPTSIALDKWKAQKGDVILLGNERHGVSSASLRAAAATVGLPMLGAKNSLNVAVCFGIVGYAMNTQ